MITLGNPYLTDPNLLPSSSQPASVEMPSPAFDQQFRDLRPCRDLMGGTEAMRRAGGLYIHQEDCETPKHHLERIGRTVLRNVFKQTVQYSRGQVFSRPVALDNADGVLTDEQFDMFQQWQEDVDQKGKNLTTWAGDAFQQGLVDGVTFCLVDYPSIETQDIDGVSMYLNREGEWRPRTAASVQEEGWQPYLVLIQAAQVLDCRTERRNGKQVVTHFRYIETTTEDDPANVWGQDVVQYIHAYWLDHWELWKRSSAGEGKFELRRSGRLSLNEIPLAIFMPGDKRTECTAQPALMDLAWLNIRHWQATCEQYDLMSYVRRPPWYITGVMPEVIGSDGKTSPRPFGPGHVVYLNSGGMIGSACVASGSVEAGRSELQDLEEAMASYGLQILQRPGLASATATQVSRESRETNSQLKNWALGFQDFLENCLRFVALWQGYPDGPNAKCNDEFAATANVDYLLQLHDKGLVSKETLAVLMKRSGVLPDDFDFEAEAARLARDTANTANAGQSFLNRLSDRLRNPSQTPPAGGSNNATPSQPTTPQA